MLRRETAHIGHVNSNELKENSSLLRGVGTSASRERPERPARAGTRDRRHRVHARFDRAATRDVKGTWRAAPSAAGIRRDSGISRRKHRFLSWSWFTLTEAIGRG